MSYFFKIIALGSGLWFLVSAPQVFSAEPLPLSTGYWKDPAFLRSFNGSYRIEARIEPTVSTEERGLLVDIQKLMADGKREGALEKLKASPLTAKSPALTFNLANVHFELGENEEAIAAYQSALNEYPSFRRAHRNLALAHVRENELDEALPHLIEAIRLGDSEGSTYGLLGYCRIVRQEWASALQAYRLAQVTEPDVPEWKAGIAQCLQNLDEKQEAVALLDEVIRERPLEASYSVLQAGIHLDLGDSEAAVKALDLPFRLELLDPDNTLLLADLHLRALRPEATQAAITSAFSGDALPSSTAVLRLVSTATTQADWPLVKDLLERLPEEPDNRPAQLATARYLIESAEDAPKGEKMLEQMLRQDPTDGQPILALARHHAASGREDSAELLLERAAADSTTAHDAHIELARLHVGQARYREALISIDAALALSPTDDLRRYRQALQQTIAASE